MKPTFNPGTISHGTLNPAHLLSAYIAALEGFTLTNGDYFSQHHDERDTIANAIGEAQDCFSEDGTDIDEAKDEEANWLVNEKLPDLFDKYAPNKHQFRSHEGDGSDIGFWQYDNDDDSDEEPEPLSKIAELEALAAFRATLPADPLQSYLGNWLDAAMPTIASDIRNDIFPTITPAQTRAECAELKKDAEARADAILKNAEAKAKKVEEEAKKVEEEAERKADQRQRFTNEATEALRRAIYNIESI
jgi:hypothetical protein